MLVIRAAQRSGRAVLSPSEQKVLRADPRAALWGAVARGAAGSLAILLCRLALLTLAAVLAVCLAGAFSVVLDRVNHFQPFIMLASLAVLAFAWVAGEREQLAWYALMAAVNVMFFFAPVIRLPTHVLFQPGGEQIKVMTFNYLYWQPRGGEVIEYIKAQSPDIVLLQEVTHRTGEWLNSELADLYPYRRFCNRCDVSILSKRAFSNIKEYYRDWHDTAPALIASYALASGRELRVAGVHLMNPYAPRRQERELAALTRELSAREGPLIVAGDLNLTPWSWTLNRFSDGLGLRRHTGLLGTWSTSRAHILPWFPIDHVLSSRDMALVSVERGPKLGSDHLPVIATLVLPRN